MAEERCDWCQELLHTYLDADDDLQVDVHAHLQKCPMITQFAMLLMHPRWSAPALQPLTWASQEHICENRRKHELKMWQFNVSTSDTYGQSLEHMAQCGMLLLDDPLVAESVHFRCLLCFKVFFLPAKLCEHLHRHHNYSQLQTYMCYARLIQRCNDPCQFCGLKKHSQQCPVLLNLAVYLLNGHGLRGLGRHRRGFEDLGQPSDQGPDGQSGNLLSSQRGQSRQQKTSNRSPAGSQRQLSLTLCCLVLRHEDTINSLLQESQFLLHLAPGPGSILPLMLETSRIWHQQTEKSVPLRHLLAQTMMQEMERRLTKLKDAAPTEELFQDCKSYHLVKDDNNRTMPYLRWSHQRKCLEPTDQTCLPITEVHRSLQNILRLMQDHRVTLRFHSLKKMADNKETQQAVPWVWTVAQRHDPELWHEVAKLAFHSSWQLIQVRLRPQGLERTPLAKQIQKMM